MPWETRPWATMPSPDVLRTLKGLPGYRVRLHLDPRSFETEDANLLRVEGTVLAHGSDGPTLYLEERDTILGAHGAVPMIDILAVERLT